MPHINANINSTKYISILKNHFLAQINDNLGAGTVSLTDMSKLQFCQATIGQEELLTSLASLQHFDLFFNISTIFNLNSDAAEIQRLSVVAISGIQHRVTKTVGHSIAHSYAILF